ncbi:hypothetical protein H5410_011616 [Solanum commersonii]|uniref:Uncharacterized protein n=1 Tax=Solanum commersonii TaxID=4109 RepID=A0A9J6AP70_SOLCO|nr:hypothetical protein H5410_011616 [Solanum commersonii]
MSMSNNQAKETIVYFRKRKTKEAEEVVANVVASPAQQEAKTIEEGRAYSPNSSMLNTRQSKGGGAVNAKIISDNLEEERNTWNPYDESTKESLLVQPTQQETNGIQLGLVHKRNIDYAISPLEFAKDLGGTSQRPAHTRVRESTLDAAREGTMARKENNNIMSIADYCAQRGNKGISISERSLNSRSEEMANFLGTSNDYSSGQNLQFQNMNQAWTPWGSSWATTTELLSAIFTLFQEAKTIEEGRAYSPNSSMLNTRQSKGGGALNAKIICDNLEEDRNTWNLYDESTKESLLVQPTQQETNRIQLALVHKRNIDYAISPLEFAKDLGGTSQRPAHTRVCESTLDAAREGTMARKENNNIMSIADYCAQRGNKGISISERSLNSRSEEMANFLGTSNDHSSGQNLQFQNMNQVSPNYLLSNGMKEMSVRPSHHKRRIIVHPSTIIGPSRFSPNYEQNMQRTSVSAPRNFSSMNLLKGNENTSSLTGEELLNDQDLLSTDQGLSSEEQRLLQSPYSQVGNYQNMQRTPESATSDISHLGLLMEGEDISTLTYDLYGTQPLSTQHSLSSEGQMVQQWSCSQVGNYQFGNSSAGQMVQQWPWSQVGNYQLGNSSEGQRVQKLPISQVGNGQFGNSSAGQRVLELPISQVGNDLFGNSSAGQMMQQWPVSQEGIDQFGNLSAGQMVQQQPCSQVGNYTFENSLQQISLQNHQNQVLPQPEEISFRELLARDDISYMDLLTREDLLISWT